MGAVVSRQRDIFDGPCFTIGEVFLRESWEKGLHPRKGRMMSNIRYVRTQ